jgi:hypothetical protein
VYPEFMASNISPSLDVLSGNGYRWRVHI